MEVISTFHASFLIGRSQQRPRTSRKVSVAAEVLAYPAWGIGTQMDTARTYLQTEKLFAWTIAVIGIGLLFDYFVDYLLRKPFTVWKGAEDV